MSSHQIPRLPLIAISSVSFALLVDEILLSSIFHVLIGGGNTAAAISVALLGLSCSGVFAYLHPALRNPSSAQARLPSLLFWFGVSLMGGTMLLMSLPLNHSDLTFAADGGWWPQLLSLAAFLIAAVPFFLGGLAISILLRSNPANVSLLYFADLAGAAAGCLAGPLLLTAAGAPRGIIFGAIPAVVLASAHRSRTSKRAWLALPVLLLAAVVLHPGLLRFRKLPTMGEVRAPQHRSFHVTGDDLDFEKWALDAWTIIRSERIPQQWQRFAGWGLSESYRGPVPRLIQINFNARFSTYVTELDGDLGRISEWLDSDLVSLHYLLGRRYAKVLNIGAGGGREVLNALHHGARKVTAVDVSEVVVEDLMKGRLADFSGRLYLDPRVEAIADEGRSFAERATSKFDLIDFSIVGGMNMEKIDLVRVDDLFTEEALDTYVRLLEDDGVLSYVMYSTRSDLVSELAERDFLIRSPYTPALRTLAGLRRSIERYRPGSDFRSHALVAGLPGMLGPSYDLIHIVVGKRPFTAEERRQFIAECRALQLVSFYPADQGGDNFYARIIEEPVLDDLARSLPFNVEPPTDDVPFQFGLDRRHLRRAAEQGALLAFLAGNPVISQGFKIALLAAVILLTPVVYSTATGRAERPDRGASWGFSLFFAGIGFGYMVIEMAILLELQLYLGKPIYGLSVGLFSFLFASALGSAFTRRLELSWRRSVYRCVGALGLAGLGFFFLSSSLYSSTFSSPLPIRILVAVASIAPLAFVMGMFFPLGVQALSRRHEELIPWVWAINGSLSVLGIWGGRAAALFIGFDRSLWVGLSAYLVVAAAVFLLTRSSQGIAGINGSPSTS